MTLDSTETGLGRAKLFVTNMLVYGLGGIAAKLIPLVMLPVVTRLMPGTAYFGLADLSTTLVSFAQAFAVMGMYDAMFRMFFEKDDLDYKKNVCATALLFVTGSSLAVFVGMFVLQDPIARLFFGSAEFSSLAVVSAVSVLVGGNNTIIQAPTRMQNKRLLFIVMNLVTAVLSYAISIPMILFGEYLLALPVAAMLASASSLVLFAFFNRKWFSIRYFDGKLLKEMLVVGIPLMPTFLFYWVFNSADRLMIVNLIGADASGVYAAASKIGHMSQLIYTAFAQGWQYFAFSTMRDDDQVELNSRIYEYLGVVSFLTTGLLAMVVNPLFSIIFPEQYSYGAVSSVYLFLAPLLLMLYQVASNQLLVVKKTWPTLIVLFVGAVSNIVLNLLLIPILGIEGASIATLAGYVLTNVGALALLTKMELMHIGWRFGVAAAAMLLFLVWWRLLGYGLGLLSAVGFIVLAITIGWLYRYDIRSFGKRAVEHIHAK